MIVISNQDHDEVILIEIIFLLLIYLYFHSTLIYYYLYYKHIIGTFSYRNILKLAFLESIL